MVAVFLKAGMTMSGRSRNTSSPDSRYEFTCKERDYQTTGLDYFGARYYDSWRGQWTQVDPMEDKYPGWSSYNYVLDNPIRLVDPTGAVTYTIDGVEVDQELGQQLSEQYQRQMDWGNKDKNNSHNDKRDESSQKNSNDTFKNRLFTLSTGGGISYPFGLHVEFGMLFPLEDLNNNTYPTFRMFYQWGYSLGSEAYIGLSGNTYRESLSDFMTNYSLDWTNSSNWNTVQIGFTSFTFDSQNRLMGGGISASYGTSFAVHSTNYSLVTIPFPLQLLLDPVFTFIHR